MIELPTLYSKDAKGKLIQWRVWNEGDVVVTEHGKVGGKQAQNRDRALATNVGRSNERLGEAQAEFEAQAKWEKKVKQGYLESMDEAKTAEVLLPMLAHPLVKKSRNSKGIMQHKQRAVEYPAHVQRKLNGLRCLAIIGHDGTVTLKSRQGTVWDTLEHIEAEVALLGKPGDIFDGEIYLHGTPLQTINGWIKNASDPAVAPLRNQLQYHIYDMPSSTGSRDGGWEDRKKELEWRFGEYVLRRPEAKYLDMITSSNDSRMLAEKYCLPLQLVETETVYNEADVKDFAAKAISGGYEGVIIRQLGHGYTFGKRKDALIKYKDFTDEEFEVIDIESREYFDDIDKSYPILARCICRNNLDDQTFEVVPLGTIQEKKEMWENKEIYIGKRLVVRYLERSEGGLPQGNPVGLAFRLDEDNPLEDEDEFAMWE